MAISTLKMLLTLGVFLFLARPAHAFGAGNIGSTSAVEGVNWRHGDIEDTLLTLMMARAAGGRKFDKMMVARVYFGNWLRDYSQAIDVGTVKYVSAEAIRILLWVLGFMTFGFGTREFEVTSERLGCYRPEDHIDNPKDYADNLDARDYDPRLRGPVNEHVELGIDPQRGLKNYIASEELGIVTSAAHVRKLFSRSIQLGRSYGRGRNEADLFEALRLMGTGLHCLEDWSAHSNYCELVLIEMGERDIFPHVGRQTQIHLPGVQRPVYPVVTGTFGGVDFLHSVMGEFDDKATQSEIQQLEGTMYNGSRADTSILKDILSKIPSGLLGDNDKVSQADELENNSNAARMHATHITPKRPEAITHQMMGIQRQIYPILEWHDEIMRKITETIESIPVLPELVEQLEDQINIFVFSLLAPFMIPVIQQLKTELNTGSSEIIQSSKDKQLVVFSDDHCSDPTHSMLSKDHFSDVLNEPAGRVASQVIKWVVPQLMEAWDNNNVDPERTINRIINGVFHHPALRNAGNDGASDGRKLMFNVVENWWRQANQDDLRQQLSREGVESGRNHKPGQHDTGHGCGKPIGMAKMSGGDGAGGMLSELVSALAGGSGAANTGQGYGRPGMPSQASSEIRNFAEQAVGGGALGGIVGALAGGVGGSLLGGAFGGDETQSYTQQYQAPGGGVTQSYTEFGRTQNQYGQPEYGQAQYQQTTYPDGQSTAQYKQYNQEGDGTHGVYGYEQRTESRPMYGGGYEQTESTTFKSNQDNYGRERHHKKSDDESSGDDYRKKEKHHHKKHHSRGSNEGSSDQRGDRGGYGGGYEYGSGRNEYEGGRNEYGGGRNEYGSRRGGDEFREPPREEYGGGGYGRQQGGFGGEREVFGGRNEYGGERNEYEGGRNEYGGQQQERFGSNDFRRGRNEYGGQSQEQFGGAHNEYGGQPQERFGGNEYGGRQEYGGEQGFGGEFQEQREESIPGGFAGDESEEYGNRAREEDEYQEENREDGERGEPK